MKDPDTTIIYDILKNLNKDFKILDFISDFV